MIAKINRKLTILMFHYLNFVLSADSSSQLILINFVVNVARKDIIEQISLKRNFEII